MLQQQHQKMSWTTEFVDDKDNHFFNLEIENTDATMVNLREKGVNRQEYFV